MKQEYVYHSGNEYNMRGEYINKCEKCDKVNSIFSQADENPEYYTTVIARCTFCEHPIRFSVAVN